MIRRTEITRGEGTRGSRDVKGRDRGRERPDTGAEGQRRPFMKRRVCRYCDEPAMKIDYKDVKALRPFLTERGKIVPRRISGNCAGHQREVSVAIKRARNMALIPYITTTM
ncbi:MAG: 30S ribosomal protein S18 [Deltaproteobacteria bacterium]|nr:30S ribosomal protein S18 [Deltaproteobacteria bacterium]